MREGRQTIPDDLFANAKLAPAAKPLTIFRAELTGCDEAGWEDLFAGYTALKAITFSSSIEMLLRLAERLDDHGNRLRVRKHSVEGASGARPGQPDRRGLWLRRRADRSEGAGRSTVPAARACRQAAARSGRRRLAALSPAARAPEPREALPAVRAVRLACADRLRQSRPRRLRGLAARDPCRVRRRAGLAPVRRLLSARLEGQRAGRAGCAGCHAAPTARRFPAKNRCSWTRCRSCGCCRPGSPWSISRRGRRRPALRRTRCGRRQRSAPNSRTLLCRRTRPAAPSSMRARCCA